MQHQVWLAGDDGKWAQNPSPIFFEKGRPAESLSVIETTLDLASHRILLSSQQHEMSPVDRGLQQPADVRPEEPENRSTDVHRRPPEVYIWFICRISRSGSFPHLMPPIFHGD